MTGQEIDCRGDRGKKEKYRTNTGVWRRAGGGGGGGGGEARAEGYKDFRDELGMNIKKKELWVEQDEESLSPCSPDSI